jgi:hypothetical protein
MGDGQFLFLRIHPDTGRAVWVSYRSIWSRSG